MPGTPVRSGNGFIDGLFDLCVRFLFWLADLFGVSYQTINIWIFCILWPIVTVALIVVVIRQRLKIRKMRREVEDRLRAQSVQMDEALRQAIIAAFEDLPEGCRHPPATEDQLRAFEQEFGPIPADFRWYLETCGGGVCGAERIDGITELLASHRKFRAESCPGSWTMRGVFVVGWDGAGNPFGIEQSSGRVLVEDHNFGGIHDMAKSFPTLLARGYRIRT